MRASFGLVNNYEKFKIISGIAEIIITKHRQHYVNCRAPGDVEGWLHQNKGVIPVTNVTVSKFTADCHGYNMYTYILE